MHPQIAVEATSKLPAARCFVCLVLLEHIIASLPIIQIARLAHHILVPCLQAF
jgi:hypothetical protein